MKSRRYKSGALAMGLFTLVLMQANRLVGCGIDWQVPQNHFDGVNEYGFVSYWEQVGVLEIDETTKFPLVMGFRSDREWSSAYLGHGWILAMLDSSFVQVNEKQFTMIQPDGLTRRFYRDKPEDTILRAGEGWKAEIREDVVTAWADCGWKLVYNKGKLSSISTPKNKTINLEYTGGRVSEVKEGSSTLLKVDVNPNTNQVTGFTAQGKNYKIEQDRRPRVQMVNGQNLIGGMDSSLSKLIFPNGHQKSYEFAVDQKIEPTLKITDSGTVRSFSWNPSTKLIKTDNDWTYKITPNGENPLANAAIGRKNAKGQEEFWYRDARKGREESHELDGTVRIESWFVNGILQGKVRKVQIRNKDLVMDQKFEYNESGQIIRKSIGNILTEYDSIGRIFRVFDTASQKIIWENIYK